MRRVYVWIVSICTAFFLIPMCTFAHPLDVAYLDVGVATSSQLTLTVAIHPYQAFELIRGGDVSRFNLKSLQQKGELITAYISDRVSVMRDGKACTWDAQNAQTPQTELEAVADGVTAAGNLFCPGSGMSFTLSSMLFLEGSPSQTAIIRLEKPDGYAEQVTLDRTKTQATVDLSLMFLSTSSDSPTISPRTTEPRRTDDAISQLAQRLLDPSLGLWGFVGILLAALLIGMLHALGPGHGKSLLAASAVGHRATLGRMVMLGTVMTLTHVSDVFVMALLAGTISAVLPPTQLLRWLEIGSAMGLVVLGLFNLIRSIKRYRTVSSNPNVTLEDEEHRLAHELGHAHTHVHAHDHGHSHDERAFRQSLWMGFVGSLAPCPTAWAMFMATLAIGKLGVGLILLVGFSLGLYFTIIGIGILLVVSKTAAMKRTPPRLTYALPILSASIIICLGIALIVRLLLGI